MLSNDLLFISNGAQEPELCSVLYPHYDRSLLRLNNYCRSSLACCSLGRSLAWSVAWSVTFGRAASFVVSFVLALKRAHVSERTSDRASERSSERVIDRASDRPSERATERATGERRTTIIVETQDFGTARILIFHDLEKQFRAM